MMRKMLSFVGGHLLFPNRIPCNITRICVDKSAANLTNVGYGGWIVLLSYYKEFVIAEPLGACRS